MGLAFVSSFERSRNDQYIKAAINSQTLGNGIEVSTSLIPYLLRFSTLKTGEGVSIVLDDIQDKTEQFCDNLLATQSHKILRASDISLQLHQV